MRLVSIRVLLHNLQLRCLHGWQAAILTSLHVHGIHHQAPANGDICRIPAVKVLPNALGDHLKVKVVNNRSFQLTQVRNILLEKLFVFDAAWSLVE